MDELCSFQNLEAFEAHLLVLANSVRPATIHALTSFAQAVLEDSQENYVPVEFSDLKNSGRVEDPVVEGNVTSVSIVYGNAKVAPKAIAIHEHLSAFSPHTWQHGEVHFRVGGPKYLELPVMLHSRFYSTRLAVEIRLGLRI